MRLRGQLALIILVSILAAIALMSVGVTLLSVPVLVRSQQEHLLAMAAASAREVERILHEALNAVTLLARNPLLASTDAVPSDQLREISEAGALFPSFDDFNLLDVHGALRATVGHPLRAEVAMSAWFRAALDGVTSISDAHAIPDPARTVLNYTVPVRAPDGHTIGVLCGHFDIARIQEIANAVPVDHTGEVLIVNAGGTLICTPEPGRLLQQVSEPDITELASRGTPAVAELQRSGKWLIAASAPVNVGSTTMPRWTVILLVPRTRVLAPILKARLGMVLAAGMSMVITGLIAFGFGNRLTARLGALVRLSRRLGEGDYAAAAVDSGRDELGDLARTLDLARQRLAETDRLRREVASRREAETAARLARDAAEQANRAKSEFLANMSHELRTPLTHIMGFTDLVLHDPWKSLDPRYAEHLADVRSSGRHMLSLVNDLLDIARIEAGRLELHREPIDLRSLLDESLAMIADPAAAKGLSLKVEAADAPATIMADPRKLRQILYNLLSNAEKFTPSGGTIEVAVRPAPAVDGRPLVQISVADTGIGIAAADIARLFRPFEQIERSRGSTGFGTGLGLALCRRLVELHGGSIHAESAGPGRGATFRFTLPVGDDGGVCAPQTEEA